MNRVGDMFANAVLYGAKRALRLLTWDFAEFIRTKVEEINKERENQKRVEKKKVG